MVGLYGIASWTSRSGATDAQPFLHFEVCYYRGIELAIERLQDGEVSPFFHDEVRVGDEGMLCIPRSDPGLLLRWRAG